MKTEPSKSTNGIRSEDTATVEKHIVRDESGKILKRSVIGSTEVLN
jgi:hypothetical protein